MWPADVRGVVPSASIAAYFAGGGRGRMFPRHGTVVAPCIHGLLDKPLLLNVNVFRRTAMRRIAITFSVAAVLAGTRLTLMGQAWPPLQAAAKDYIVVFHDD